MKTKTDYITTGFPSLDKALGGGFKRGEVILIGGRPAMGKSALMMSMVTQITKDHQCPTTIFSLEMSKAQILKRLLMVVGEIDGDIIHMEKAPESGIQFMIDYLPFEVDDTPAIEIDDLCKRVYEYVDDFGTQIVFIDYLQLMGKQNMAESLEFILQRLHNLASELDIPIVVFSQMNRYLNAKGRNPRLGDITTLKSLCNIDTVLLLHRWDYYGVLKDENGQSTRKIVHVVIAKANGSEKSHSNIVKMHFEPKYTKFTEL